MTEETPEDVLKCLIFSLCAWNRGNEVIDLAVEWLNYGFGLHDLSESIVPVVNIFKNVKNFHLFYTYIPLFIYCN